MKLHLFFIIRLNLLKAESCSVILYNLLVNFVLFVVFIRSFNENFISTPPCQIKLLEEGHCASLINFQFLLQRAQLTRVLLLLFKLESFLLLGVLLIKFD